MVSEKEFSLIVGSTKKTVLSAISKSLPSRFYHAIDDIVQETYLRAFKSLSEGKFRNESSVSTWLYAIARNESIRMAEKLSREEKKEKKSVEKFSDDLLKTEENDYEKIESLRAMIEELPENQKKIIKLSGEGLNEKDISEKMGIPVGTVKSRLFRARAALKKLAEEVENG